jgi:hypothetical protein
VALLLLLAACGDEQGLTPATSPVRPDADALLAPSAHERPVRSDDLLLRSQPRPDDRFDLPPH